ncbi:hypothetical protein [Desulfomarina sp.]
MVRVIISFLAALLTGTQALLILFGNKGICLNDGCAVVDSFTRVSPFYFNLAGCLYFLFLSWCFLQVRKKRELFHILARFVLFGGIAAEGVLVFFQYTVVSTFCSYCLIVCSAIVLLTVLSGVRQVVGGGVLFFSVFLALSSLDFNTSAGVSLDEGSCAQVPGEKSKPSLYLFFSETCPHCENVIAVMGEKRSCNIRFNPIDKVKRFSFPGSSRLPEYDPLVNVNFLKNLDITEIPVLIVREQEKIQIFEGESRITRYLQENCGSETDYGTVSGTEDGGYSYLPFLQKEEGCSVDEDCEGKSDQKEK